ncbi:tyrosine-type recombinase/integrase [Polyangium sp. 6x1]|uniref:tyrosine-type recombinase/integrase n=1 Tax=Polyangium sp. 6x1 TaxID=3042689 RepID=UPI002482940B|nr:tyrosine-type recombinase/integrase [Polyangium sp. 6x1]MDI1442423.1 tyrosine-type recombinase/integrase [Polyangium sp. 6x1]
MSLPKGTSLFWRKSKKRWVLSYADPVRGQPQKVLPKEIVRQRDAETWAFEWLRVQGIRPDVVLTQRREEGLSVAACAEKWIALRTKDSRVAPATLTNNRLHLDKWILPRFGTRAIAGLEVPELRAFIRDLREQRAASTTRNVYYTFFTLYADAMAEGWVNSPANLVAHPAVQRELPELEARAVVRIPIEWARVLMGDERIALEWRARYAVAFTSGARDGEIAGLRWGDVEMEAEPSVFRIQQAVAIIGAKGEGGFAKVKGPKTKGSRRTMPLHPAAKAALVAWRERWPELVGRRPRAEDLVFPGPGGGPSRPKSAAQMREDLERVGLPGEIRGQAVEFRATRASFATWLEEAGVAEGVRKRLMGHAVRDVTERHYTARELEQLARAVAAIPIEPLTPVLLSSAHADCCRR